MTDEKPPPRPSPRPLAVELVPEAVDAHRYLDCRFYDSCLSRAAAWPSFSCSGCGVWAEARRVIDPEAERRAIVDEWGTRHL